MFMLQAPQLPKPEDVMNAVMRAGQQSVNGILMTLSAPLEIVKGLGIPVPEPPQLPAPPSGGSAPKPLFAFPFPFVGGQSDVTYEPYTAGSASEGGSEDVTIETEQKKEIWV